jgi:hypothetical protein
LTSTERLIESERIIDSHGSLDDAKTKLDSMRLFRWVDPNTQRLEQAIDDFEKCTIKY